MTDQTSKSMFRLNEIAIIIVHLSRSIFLCQISYDNLRNSQAGVQKYLLLKSSFGIYFIGSTEAPHLTIIERPCALSLSKEIDIHTSDRWIPITKDR